MDSGGLSIVSPEMLADAERLRVEVIRGDFKAVERLAKMILGRARRLRPKPLLVPAAAPVVWKEDDHPLWMGS